LGFIVDWVFYQYLISYNNSQKQKWWIYEMRNYIKTGLQLNFSKIFINKDILLKLKLKIYGFWQDNCLWIYDVDRKSPSKWNLSKVLSYERSFAFEEWFYLFKTSMSREKFENIYLTLKASSVSFYRKLDLFYQNFKSIKSGFLYLYFYKRKKKI